MTTQHPPLIARCARSTGFTLVELIAVLVVLAILAGVAAPRFFNYREQAQLSAAKGARAALTHAVEQHRINDGLENGTAGSYPPDLESILMVDSNSHLLNPYHDPRMPVYNIDPGGVNKMYMQNKTIESAIQSRWGSIWYNPNNGRVCFRVPQQANNAATIALFNEVNQANITQLNQTTH